MNARFWGPDPIKVHYKLSLRPFELIFDHFEASQKQKLLSEWCKLRPKIAKTVIGGFKRIFFHFRWQFLIKKYLRTSKLLIWDHFQCSWIILWHFLRPYSGPNLTTSLLLEGLKTVTHQWKWSQMIVCDIPQQFW